MGIILKFVLKNMSEKKSRTFLIVLSIMISSGLFFASNAFSASISKMYDAMMRVSIGSSDIVITANAKSPSKFFNIRHAESYKDQIEYVVGIISGTASYKPDLNGRAVTINLKGINWDNLQKWNPISFKGEYNMTPFAGKKIIISENTALKYGLKVNDTLALDINSTQQKFLIYGISNPVGIFSDESQGINAIVPIDILGNIYSQNGNVNGAYIKLKNTAYMQQMIKTLSKEYNKYDVIAAISPAQIANTVNQITTPFKLIVVIVSFMCMFIIFSSFKVIIAERLPVIGTLRSIGATKKTTDFILLIESIAYGAVGGVLGCSVGFVLLYLMSLAISKGFGNGTGVSVQMNPMLLLITLIFAFSLSLLSSMLPIIQVSKIPIKDIVLNTVEKMRDKKLLNAVLGIAFLAISIVVPWFVSGTVSIIANTACLAVSIAGILMLAPYLMFWFIKIFEKIYSFLFGNIGIIALKNLRDNKSMLTSLSLLIIGGASLLMVNTFCSSLTKQMVSMYVDYNKSDLRIENIDTNEAKNLEHMLYTIDGVNGVYRYFEKDRIEIPDKNDNIGTVQGIDVTKHLDFMRVSSDINIPEALKQLDQERSILLTYTLRDKFNIKVGDTLNLKMQADKGTIPYKVIGFYDTTESMGDIAMISQKYFLADAGGEYNTGIYIKTSKNAVEVENAIKDKFARYNFSIETKQEMQESLLNKVNPILNILTGFLVLAMLIGIIGIFNNFIIGFISRRRSMGIMRSVGMSKKQMLKMIFVESATVGILGGITGVFAGILLAAVMTNILKALSMRMVMQYSSSYMIASIIVSFAVTIIASLSPALKTSKLNIIQSVKFE